MKNKKLLVIVLLVFLFRSSLGRGDNVKDEGKTLEINVQVGKVTELVFPSKIAKVVKGGQPDSVLVEVLDSSLYLLPKTDTPPNVFVTTISGSSYPLNLHIASEHDIKVQVGPIRHNSTETSSGMYTDVMDLMKDLMLGKEPMGSSSLPIAGEKLLANDQIQLQVNKAYELMDWKAFVLIAKNLSHDAVIIPIEQMTLPNLLAVSSTQDMLKSKGQEGDTARVYLIVGK